MEEKRVNKPCTISVDDMVAASGKKVPKCVRKWIKKFIHQDFLNAYFEKGDVGVDFAWGALRELNVKVEVRGEENMPKDGRLYTFAGNHPLGGIDALSVLGTLLNNYNEKVRYVANGFLANLTQLSEYMSAPVDKTSEHQAKDLLKDIDDMFHTDNQMMWFPAGACSRRYNGVIQDPEWQKTFITKSRQTGRDIVPMWISGRNSRRFYFIDRWIDRVFKTNLAMYCLPDELYRGQNQTITIVFGKPIPISHFTSEKKDKEWAQWVRSEVYKLKPSDL